MPRRCSGRFRAPAIGGDRAFAWAWENDRRRATNINTIIIAIVIITGDSIPTLGRLLRSNGEPERLEGIALCALKPAEVFRLPTERPWLDDVVGQLHGASELVRIGDNPIDVGHHRSVEVEAFHMHLPLQRPLATELQRHVLRSKPVQVDDSMVGCNPRWPATAD